MSNVPKLRFKEFSGEWEKKKLGNLVDIKSGISPSEYNLKEYGKYPFLKVGTLNNCEKYQILSSEYSDDMKNIIPKSSVIFPKRGAAILMNKIRINNDEVLMDSNLMALTPNDFIITEFLFYKIIKDKLFKIADTSTIPQINNKHILPYKVIIPQKQEQEKIASFLTSVDTKIEQLTKKESLLQEYKKGVMQKIFNQEIRFKDDEKDFSRWEEKTLGNYLKHKSIKNKNKSIDLVLSVSNKKGFITQDEQFDGYEVASKDTSNYKIVKKEEYAYNPSRINVGSIARLQNFDKGIVSPMYVIFKLTNELNPIFFDNLYQTHRFKHLIRIGCSGSVRDSLNFNDMANFRVKIPCIKEQTKIANFLSSIDKKIEQCHEQLESTKKFKKALLEQMFV
jgi:type I restriction enzyme S subunit